MNKMRALKAFDDEQEGPIEDGTEFLVNDERCRALILKGKAERIGAQTAEPAASPQPPTGAAAGPVIQYGSAPRTTP